MFWRSNIDPSTVCVTAETASSNPDNIAIDFQRLCADVSVLKLASGKEHVRLSCGTHSIALEIGSGTVLRGPVYLKFQIGNFGTVPAQILTMDRLFTLWRLHKFRKKDFRLDQRRFRWLLALKALDMEQAGLSQREIADHLVDQAVGLKWRDKGSRLRSRVRRIITLGRNLCNGGYCQILSGREPTAAPEVTHH